MSESTHVPALFTPVRVGDLKLQHRVVLAPLTRFRNHGDFVPGPLLATYYSQRASTPGTLLISEGTVIAPQAGGWPHVPGLWSEAQTSEWKKITDAVHAKDSYIFAQIFAVGRVAQPAALEEHGFDVVSPSEIPFTGMDGTTTTPRVLSVPEIKEYVQLHVKAAQNAIAAGFDGVEVHCANGYLIDQFLQDTVNNRTDEYGGSIENRARFALDVVDAVSQAVGPERVGVRVSPWNAFQDMGMKDPIPTFTYFATELKKRSVAYIHATEPRVAYLHGGVQPASGGEHDRTTGSNDFLRKIWGDRPYIATGGYTRESALQVAETKGGLIAFGRLYISNPDLPRRLKENLPLTPSDRSKFYLVGNLTPEGYTDWPFADEVVH
ncbi:FMN-linked oxidoreductase [Coniophora puteana RWD-64-598 SS2]|uniref:FMN-linked oxidoreductase n=1 Tax=Coniophora puteana (strain RWD-64-598) TaxID=741705 RepID=A0A5M3MD30_CONPW|nr:FMN-linked oxidoreductase [Coniophora puteana RWD-64-598 SS2]EIW76946.1 FMN-linked oxidoreductase [Coniophora puteana RWD-64-598 SS2]